VGNKNREVWEARKHGGLVVSGARGAICIGGLRTPRLPSGRRYPSPSSSEVRLSSSGCDSTRLAQLAIGCANPTFNIQSLALLRFRSEIDTPDYRQLIIAYIACHGSLGTVKTLEFRHQSLGHHDQCGCLRSV